MGHWPLAADAGTRFESAGAATATSRPTQITSGTANTKGSWVELIAATGVPTSWVGVFMQLDVVGSQDFLIDIGIGSAGNEKVVIPDQYCSGGNTGDLVTKYLLFPLSIPAGVRVAARCQCSAATKTLRVATMLIDQGATPSQTMQRVTAYGANTADSGGQPVDPGTSVNTKGAWTQLIASTTAPIRWAVVCTGNKQAIAADNRWMVDIGIGSAGNEKVVIPDQFSIAKAASDTQGPAGSYMPVSIPAGTRLSARAMSSEATGTVRILDVIVYGVD